jgi:hypothetical protein
MKRIFKATVRPFGYLNKKYYYAVAAVMTTPCIAEASEAGSTLKSGAGMVEGVMMLFAALICVAFAIIAGVKFSKGEKEAGKLMMIGCAVAGAAIPIVKILFAAFGMEDAAVDANFDF